MPVTLMQRCSISFLLFSFILGFTYHSVIFGALHRRIDSDLLIHHRDREYIDLSLKYYIFSIYSRGQERLSDSIYFIASHRFIMHL